MHVSVVINNYNYGRFVGDAIRSALDQTYDTFDVVVVDDGSTDHSRAVIESFGTRVAPVFKKNGGQASALNAGFSRSTGDVVVFLDADDLLLPSALHTITEAMASPDIVKAHWAVQTIDDEGRVGSEVMPRDELPTGDLRAEALQRGPGAMRSPPMSGNAWRRGLLERLLPIPENDFRLCADAYLYSLAPFWGPVARVDKPLSLYRLHKRSNFSSRHLIDRIRDSAQVEAHILDAARRLPSVAERRANIEAWDAYLWFSSLRRSMSSLCAAIVPGPFVFVDDQQCGGEFQLAGATAIPFLERNGIYWGRPSDDAEAIAECERLRESGANAIVFISSTFWWLEHYAGFASHLRQRYPCLASTPDVLVFSLRLDV